MKRFLGGLIILFLLISTRSSVYAQDNADPGFNFDRAYQDYVFTLDQYNNSHSDYVLAKAQYGQAGTLVAQTKARDATAKMLEQRDEVVITYMTAVRMRLVEAEGLQDSTRNGLLTRIDTEVQWFNDHKSRLDSAGTLDDLASDSDEAKKRFDDITMSLAYESLSNIPFGKLTLMRAETNSILGQLKGKIAQVRADQTKDTSILERWALEIENKITRSLDKEIEAQALLPGFVDSQSKSTDKAAIYNNVVFKLDEARQFLRDASGFMKEIFNAIVTV
jgi:hypothetical protein